MAFKYLGPDRAEAQLDRVIAALVEGRAPRDIELRNVDVKEEPGRRDSGGNVSPGQAQNEDAAKYLADELACLANTPGAGFVILGISDDGDRIGTALDAAWLRHRIYQLSNEKLTVDVREAELNGTRILILGAPEAVVPVPSKKQRYYWRVADNCVEVDLNTWHAGRLDREGYDWSVQKSGHTIDEARTAAIEVARKFLHDASSDADALDLAEASSNDLLRRLNVVSSDGYLTNAGSLLFVATPAPAIDYIRRDHPGGDSTLRVHKSGPLLTQLAEVDLAATSSNRIVHLSSGLVRAQVRALPPLALREAIVNGITHRDWRTVAPTTVEHVGDTVTVTSPGGFIGGVSTDNIITHPSTPRYRSLAGRRRR